MPLTLCQQDLAPREACKQIETFCYQMTSNEVQLKRNHRYYTQVQGMLGVTSLTWCDFVVWAGPGRISNERIDFDPVSWEETVLKPLINFFTVHGCISSRQLINHIYMHTIIIISSSSISMMMMMMIVCM